MVFGSFLHFLLIQLVFSNDEPSMRLSVNDFPDFDNSDIVEFYYLEGSFPYTTPTNIIDEAGEQWNEYSLSHGGLGIWNKDRHLKLSIEFVCENYIGALLPTIVNNNLQWENQAVITMTKPINDTLWSESRLLAVSNGAAYKYLKQYLKDNQKKYTTYQPVTVNLDNQNTLITSQDSYSFVEDLFNELVDYRLPLNTFLPIQRSFFSYYSSSSSSIQKLSWTSSSLPPLNVTQWYSNLTNCYTKTWQTDKNAALFLLDVQACYSVSEYAFVYDSPTSVYQIHLSSSLSSPVLFREVMDLPEVSTLKGEGWSVTDTILTTLFFTVALGGLFLFLYRLLWLKTARSKGSLKDDEDVSILVEEMIKNRREAASVTPSATKTGTVRSSQTGRDTIASQRDTLYNYFNRKTDPNVEENDSKPSGILSFLRFRSKGYTKFPTTGSDVNDNYTVLLPSDERRDNDQFSSQASPQSSPHSSIRFSRGSATTTTRLSNPIQPMTSTTTSFRPSNNSATGAEQQQKDSLAQSNNEFLDFIQQPTTKLHTSPSPNTQIVRERSRE